MHTWDVKMRLKWKWTWKSMLETWHLSATCLNYSYPVRPDALEGALNFDTWITCRFQCLQIGCGCKSPYTPLFLLCVISVFFKWYKKGEPSKSFRCWNIKETVHPAYMVEQVFWIQIFNNLDTSFGGFIWAKTLSVGKNRMAVAISSLVSKTCR